MNNGYFETKILSPFEQVIFPRGRAAHQKRIMVHLDNCSVHISLVSISWLEKYGMCYVLHPPYSPDLALSDFHLSSIVKEKLEWIQVRQENQLYECSQEILEDINHNKLNWVFRA
jgi:histone-lysine N-methyltransferase SETMAR